MGAFSFTDCGLALLVREREISRIFSARQRFVHLTIVTSNALNVVTDLDIESKLYGIELDEDSANNYGSLLFKNIAERCKSFGEGEPDIEYSPTYFHDSIDRVQ